MTELAALENLRAALDAALAAAVACEGIVSDATTLRLINLALQDGLSDCRGMIAEIDDPEPCTESARRRGCSCREGSTREYEPSPIIDKWCPLHGRCDPDAARDARMDAAE